jgi:phage gp16-like protein
MAKNQKLSAAQKLAINQANRQKIHIAKNQLGLDDFVYKRMLRNITGKESTADMNWRELDAVLGYLKKTGFKEKKAVKNGV